MSEPTSADLVRGTDHGPVRLLTLNRPERLNAWTNELEDQYFDLLASADADPDVAVIVVTGAGRGFCSGADLDGLSDAGERKRSDLDGRRRRDFPLGIRKPLIGAINGAAAGLGFVEALYFDVRFGCPDTLFLTAFARRGLAAEYGISWMLPRLIGRSRAADLLLSSRKVYGDEAFRIGLLDHLVPSADVVDAAITYADDIARNCAPWSLATMKRQLDVDTDRTFEAARDEAVDLMFESFGRSDLTEGIASHRERRAPRFASLD